MKFFLKDIKFPVDMTDSEAVSYMKTNLPGGEVSIFKKSVDARKKEEISFVYTFLADAPAVPSKWKKRRCPTPKKRWKFLLESKSFPIVLLWWGQGRQGCFVPIL